MDEQILKFTTSDDLTLIATDIGPQNGQAVIMLHGGGQTRRAWAATAKVLASRGYRAITVDLRGHGESDWAADGQYQMDLFADDLRTIIAKIGGTPVLVGASLGGLTSILACGEPPAAPLAALVLVDIVPWMEPKGGEQVVGFMRGTSGGFDTLDEAADAIASYLPHRNRPSSPSGLTKNLRQHNDGRWYWHWDPAFVSPQKGWDMDVMNTRLTKAVCTISAPLLLVRGTKSEIVSDAAAQQFRDLLPMASQIDIAGAHHMVAGDDNDAFLSALVTFIENNVVAEVLPNA